MENKEALSGLSANKKLFYLYFHPLSYRAKDMTAKAFTELYAWICSPLQEHDDDLSRRTCTRSFVLGVQQDAETSSGV